MATIKSYIVLPNVKLSLNLIRPFEVRVSRLQGFGTLSTVRTKHCSPQPPRFFLGVFCLLCCQQITSSCSSFWWRQQAAPLSKLLAAKRSDNLQRVQDQKLLNEMAPTQNQCIPNPYMVKQKCVLFSLKFGMLSEL